MNIKQLRQRVGKKVELIALELDVAVSTIHNWEQCRNIPRMTPMEMGEVMRVYQCTFDEFLQASRLIAERKESAIAMKKEKLGVR